jgi:CRISPR/Cas system type I-B associated protein Csh2 (Cas7 group RAMP superfamily)|tara:strand:- start:289 stop:516 length:228 start_codon:yes stop_codon:yes gene_type:complete
MTLLTKGMGVVKKILTKNRKDKLLDSIRTRRTRNLPKSLQNKKVKIEGKEYKSDQHIMDVETYGKVHQKKFKGKK